jgi:hypothetical protein
MLEDTCHPAFMEMAGPGRAAMIDSKGGLCSSFALRLKNRMIKEQS